MSKPKLLFALFLCGLLVADSYYQQIQFERLDKELDESFERLSNLSDRVLDCYALAPNDIGSSFGMFCCDDTFDRMDSLVMLQCDLLNRMADCCPRKFRRRLVLRVGRYCDIRRMVDVAEFPFIYKDFGPKLRKENPPFIPEN